MKALLVSDFNLQNFAGYLRNAGKEQGVDLTLSPIGQVTRSLLDESSGLWHPAPDFCVIWTQPEAVLPSFQALLQGQEVSPGAIEAEVDAFAQLVRQAARRTPIVLLPTWVMHHFHSGNGLSDLAHPNGNRRCLMAANLRLLEAVEPTLNVYPLAAEKWMQVAGQGAFSPRLWYGAKVPFGSDVFKLASQDVRAALQGIRGRSRRLILVDLDDTLWGGLVGETGMGGLVLGGHDPVGEAMVDFQKGLLALKRRGVALGILSKNDESVALEAIRSHPDMVLRLEDFAGWRINWEDKAQNLQSLVNELRLGLDSVVFIDDNPAERARVREAFPEVLVPEWPEDKRLYAQTLFGLNCFDKPTATKEDRQRAQMYTEERARSEVRVASASVEDWLAGLNIAVTASRLNNSTLARITQLLNKSNQMNLTTRRLTEPELLNWASLPTRQVWGIRVADRFGDSGLTGVLSVETRETKATIIDFVLSCRVMGRCIEETMIHVAVAWAKSAGMTSLEAVFLPTAKNRPCLEFLRRSGLREEPDLTFSWDTAAPYSKNPHIRLECFDAHLDLSNAELSQTPQSCA